MSNPSDDLGEIDSTRLEKSSERDKGGKKNVGQATKGKDLSHVPCKFFKVGQCTAGSSCVFSHHVVEPGETKEVCSWFVKANCKFGHKCALAHIYPGEPMSMDRKNKKTAQQQQQQQRPQGAANGARKDGKSNPQRTGRDRTPASNLTARLNPTSTGARPPMSISKAVLSPSAPAPSLRDADFAAGPMDDFDDKPPPGIDEVVASGTPAQATAWRRETIPSGSATATPSFMAASEIKEEKPVDPAPSFADAVRRPSPLPLSTPSAPRGFTHPDGSPTVDFGPVGSPPRLSPMSGSVMHSPTRLNSNTRVNGLSSGISPGTSPTRGPSLNTNSPFSAPSTQSIFANDFTARPSIAASLGPSTTLASRAWDIHPKQPSNGGVEGEDDDIEDFLPSSLSELLTPAEMRRRESRTGMGALRPSLDSRHQAHGHSMSVPALSLMDHMKNIWSDDSQGHTLNSNNPAATPRAFGPSSFTGSGMDGLSPNLLGTSNVSAGFLSSMNHGRPNAGYRSVSDTHTVHPQMAHSPSKHVPSSFITRPSFDHHSSYGFHPIPTGQHEDSTLSSGLGQLALSPTSRALQSHAPGTSLPKGLAAGYSRIHARPGPSMFGALSPPSSAGFGDGSGGAPPMSRVLSSGNGTGTGGTPSPTPPTLMQVPSGASLAARRTKIVPVASMSSPLAGPVITNDMEEELFEMEG